MKIGDIVNSKGRPDFRIKILDLNSENITGVVLSVDERNTVEIGETADNFAREYFELYKEKNNYYQRSWK